MSILTLLLSMACFGQENEALLHARALYSQGHVEEAISLVSQELSADAQDVDARVLLGLILSWEKRYDEARGAFAFALEQKPDYKDAVLGLIHVEFWSGHPKKARELAEKALVLHPGDADYAAELTKIRATESITKPEAGVSKTDDASWEVGVATSNIFFSDKRSSWHETAVDLSKNFTAGWVTATFSHASWFGSGSNMIDLQSYPKIRPGTYGFVDVAFSPDATLYAHRRFGGEIFQSLPKGFEASAGFRYMRFNNNTLLYTASVGKWFGNYWILGRTYVSPDAVLGSSTSFQVSMRKYYRDADHFIGLRLGEGASPFEVQSINDIGIQRSASVAFESLWKFENGFRMRLTSGVARQTRQYIGPLWQIEADCTIYFRY